MKTERLQKILAKGGLASRRHAETLITEGRVRVNGKVVTELGAKADPMKDKVEVDGKRVVAEDPVYVLLHKPRGVVSTMFDPEGRPTVAESLSEVRSGNGKQVRVFPVGRLDFATSGALLATNDGAFSDALLHPREGVPKTYVVKVSGTMQEADLERWREGVQLEDGMTRHAKVTLLRHEEGGKTWIELTIREGRNQQIRRMGEATGFPVMRLARTSFAEVSTEHLPPGKWRFISRDELTAIKKLYGVPKRIPGTAPAGMGGMDRPGRAPRGRGERNDRNERTDRGERRLGAEARAPRGPNTHARGEKTASALPRPDREAARGRDLRDGASGERAERRPRPQAGPATFVARRGRGAPGARPAEAEREREGEAAKKTTGAGDRFHSSGRGRGGAGAAPATSPRYGGGSPGRRNYDVTNDWGGGAERGRSSSGDVSADADRQPRGGGRSRAAGGGRGSSGEASNERGAPRGDLGGGRFGRTRTTGTAGGIGATSDVSRDDRSAGAGATPSLSRRGAGRSDRAATGGRSDRGAPSGGKSRGGSGGGTRGSSGGRGGGRHGK